MKNFVLAGFAPKRMMKLSASPMILDKCAMPKMMINEINCAAPRKIENNYTKSSNLGILSNLQIPPPPPPPPNPFNNNKNNNIKDGINRLIMGQDTMEGFWEENEETKKICQNINGKNNDSNGNKMIKERK